MRLDGDDRRSQPCEGTSPYREASSLGKATSGTGTETIPTGRAGPLVGRASPEMSSVEVTDSGERLGSQPDRARRLQLDPADDERYRALTSTGLEVPADLHAVPRTLWSDPADPHLQKFYDRVAGFTDDDRPALSLDYREGGYFDFEGVALPWQGLSRTSLSWRISDHYSPWAAFDLG